MAHNKHKKRQKIGCFLNSLHHHYPSGKRIYSATWILVPYLSIIAILIIMTIRMYRGNKRTYRLNKNLSNYISTVHDMQNDLVQLSQTLNEVSSNEELKEGINDKIRLSIWRINTMQDTLNKLVGLEKEAKWMENRQSSTVSTPPSVQKEQLQGKSNSSKTIAGFPSANNQEFLEKVFIIIRENYVDTRFNVDTLSYKMGMSRSSFFNKIKAISGQAPADFIRQYRIERAKELLKTRQYTITEIAFKSGFSDVKYFRDVFKKKYNQSPSQFAKSN